MHKGKLDASETSRNYATRYAKGTQNLNGTYLSSSDSFNMGTPVCMVCIRKT